LILNNNLNNINLNLINNEDENNNNANDYNSNRNSRKINKESNSIVSVNTLIIDENIVKLVEELGYKREYIMKSLNSNELNYSTASYYLLLNSKLDL